MAKVAVKLKSRESIPSLIELLRSRDPAVVRAAAHGLEAITRERFGDKPEVWAAWWDRAPSK